MSNIFLRIGNFIHRLQHKNWNREIRFLKQRYVRGWDDSETFSLDHSLAKVILPRLKRFKEITVATPGDLTEKEWHDILDQMIETFEFIASEKYWDASVEDVQKLSDGLDLFAKNYFRLWW